MQEVFLPKQKINPLGCWQLVKNCDIKKSLPSDAARKIVLISRKNHHLHSVGFYATMTYELQVVHVSKRKVYRSRKTTPWEEKERTPSEEFIHKVYHSLELNIDTR